MEKENFVSCECSNDLRDAKLGLAVPPMEEGRDCQGNANQQATALPEQAGRL